MKKSFTRIMAALALLVFMAPCMVGWGQSSTSTITIDYSSVTDFPSGSNITYGAYHWESDDVSGTINCANGNQNGTSVLQFNYSASGTSNGRNAQHVANTVVVPGYITGITMTKASGTDRKWNAYVGTSALTSTNYSVSGIHLGEKTVSSDGVTWTTDATNHYNYFYLNYTVGSASYISSIVITYEPSTGPVTPTCATPTFSPAAGTYTQAQNVSISCATDGATIYYTTNGNDPTTTSSVYSGAINVSTNTTIKAMAVAEGYNNSAVATAEYTFITLDHDGTLEDPYSVADARTAIDANAGTQGVYATGIVSAIPTAWSTDYSNITFNFVDNEGDNDFLQAFRCVSTDNADASKVAVGDEVVVYGNLTKYGSTYEFGQGCQLISLTHPTHPIIIANDINLTYDATSGSIAYSISNPTSATLTATSTADWISNINVGSESVTFTTTVNEGDTDRSATITLSYTGANNLDITVTQGHFIAPTYAELPFAFNGGKADIEDTDGLSQEGLGTDYAESTNPTTKLKFDSAGDWLLLQFDERPGTLTFDIKNNNFSGGTFKVQTSENGVTFTDLKTYTEINGTQNEEFTDLGENVRYIKWIYTAKVSGNVGLGNIALAEYVVPVVVASITVNPNMVELDSDEHEGTLNLAYEKLPITDMSDFAIQFYDANNEEMSEELNWIEVLVAEQDPNVGEGYVVSYTIEENESEARTAYFKVYAMDDETNLVYSNLVTINQAAYVAPFEGGTYQLATSIESGKTYIITSELFVDEIYAMGADRGNNRGAVSVDIDETTITVEPGLEVYEFVITSLDDPQGFYSIYDPRNAGYLYAAGGTSSNHLKTKADLDNKGQWTITFGENNEASIVANFGNEKAGDPRNTMRFNSTNNPPIFSCYVTGGQSDVYLYKKVEPETESYTLTINGYTDAESKAGYYLIASPVTVNIADVAGLTEGDFDLYSYDESQELEWINYKQEDGSHPFTTLEPGKGYLYAKKATAETPTYTFTLTGTPYDGTPIVLSKQSTGTLAGWNLIGNPSATSNIAPGRAFYIMNSTIGELIASESSTVEPKQGFFVIATEDGEEFEWTAPLDGNLGKVVMNLSRNRGTVVDRAIVRFGEGDQLPKFQLNPNNTKIYFAQADNDYAVVRSASEGEMPVSFRASENGTYTLSFSAENTEMRYMHLIDNMTGNDIDLLQTPSYSFEAKTTDYANRFRIVFNANNGVDEMNEDQFAFFNGSELVINNEGEATLQVIDMMGRVLSSQTINGNANVNINEAKGVYVIRLIQNDLVKTQKIVKE